MGTNSDVSDWATLLPLKRAELHALMAEMRAVRREVIAKREASAQSRCRLQQTWVSIAAQWGMTPPADPQPATPAHRSYLLEALNVAGLFEGDLDDVANSMCAAYQAAVARDDDEAQGVLRDVLMSVGHHLASQIGPKAAGVVLS